jgi:hypothetical protein
VFVYKKGTEGGRESTKKEVRHRVGGREGERAREHKDGSVHIK